MDLSPEQVRAAVQKELNLERSKTFENVSRTILAFSIGILFAMILVKDRNRVLPDPDLVTFVEMPALTVPSPPLVQYEEEVLINPVPPLEPAPVQQVDPNFLKKSESDLRKKVYSERSMLLVRKPPQTPLRCFILREDEKSYHVIDNKTQAKFVIPKTDVVEIKKWEDIPKEK